jgi:hypothetical protein
MLADNALKTKAADMFQKDVRLGVECFRQTDGAVPAGSVSSRRCRRDRYSTPRRSWPSR